MGKINWREASSAFIFLPSVGIVFYALRVVEDSRNGVMPGQHSRAFNENWSLWKIAWWPVLGTTVLTLVLATVMKPKVSSKIWLNALVMGLGLVVFGAILLWQAWD